MRPVLFLTFLMPTFLFGQTVIYRSIQINKTSAIATPTSITISGSTLTTSALPDSIGLGDAIQYDSTGLNLVINAIVFIHGRTSSTEYTVKRANGTTPPSVTGATNASVFRSYISAANAEAGTENTGISVLVRNFDTGNVNLVAVNQIWNFVGYRGEDIGVLFDGWITGSANYVRFFTPVATSEVGTSQRHSGIWTANGYSIKVNAGSPIQIGNGSSFNFIRLDGLQVWQNGSGASGAHAIEVGNFSAGYNILISNCIIRGGNGIASTVHSGVHIFTNSSTAGTIKVSNCIIYDFNSTSTISAGSTSMRAAGGTMYVHNVTSFNNKMGYQRTNGTLNVNNSIANTHGIVGGDGFTGTVNGNFNISNLSSDAPGANSKNSTVVAFVDSASGNFLLKASDTAAKDSGTDLSGDANLSITNDILGTARPVGSAFDIGAHEEPLEDNFIQSKSWRRRVNR